MKRYDQSDLASVRFENFSVESSNQKQLPPKMVTSFASGKLDKIKAHAGRSQQSVQYREITDVEFVSDGREFLGFTQSDDRYAVSFKVKIEIKDRNGKVQFPLYDDQPASTRITYWNLKSEEIFGLKFLRSDRDRLGFIQACNLPDLLMRIATELLLKQPRMSRTAYERAIWLLRQSNRFDQETMVHFASYIGLLNTAHKRSLLRSALSTYRGLDLTGEAGLDLANALLADEKCPDLVEAVLVEAAERLIIKKPSDFSARLYHILSFAIEQNLRMPLRGILAQLVRDAAMGENNKWVVASLANLQLSAMAS